MFQNDFSLGVCSLLTQVPCNTSGVATVTLYVYDKEGNKLDKVSGILANFKDIAGGSTALGSSIPNRYQLNGYLKDFTYSSNKFTDEQITSLYSQGQGNKIDYNYDSIGRLNNSTVNTGLAQFNTSYTFQAGKEAGTTTAKVSSMKNGNEELKYTYDVNGNIETIIDITLNKTIKYTYNELNEVVREDNGTDKIHYTYDTWGKLISIEGSLKDIVGVKNPYRYREYRYDTETGLYYLNARYYNAEWGRFINADVHIFWDN